MYPCWHLNLKSIPNAVLILYLSNLGRCFPALDESWTEELESRDACSRRGYNGLLWMMQQREQNILLVCHGGLLNYTMNSNSNVVLVDRRKVQDEPKRCITKRFGNCEMREFVMTAWDSNDYSTGDETGVLDAQINGEKMEPVITLEEVTMEVEELNYADSNDSEKKMEIM